MEKLRSESIATGNGLAKHFSRKLLHEKHLENTPNFMSSRLRGRLLIPGGIPILRPSVVVRKQSAGIAIVVSNDLLYLYLLLRIGSNFSCICFSNAICSKYMLMQFFSAFMQTVRRYIRQT